MHRLALTFIILSLFFSAANVALLLYYYDNIIFDRAALHGFASEGSVALRVEGNDTSPPLVSITNPQNTSYSSHRTVLEYEVSDNNIELGTCWYSLDLGITNTTITCGNNASSISSSEGSNTWRVYANDTSGNFNFSSVTFSVSIPPSIPGVSSGGGGGGASVPAEFAITPEDLSLFLFSGELTQHEIIVTNLVNRVLYINASLTGLAGFAEIDTDSFSLLPKQSKTIILTVKSPQSGVYGGRIGFTSGKFRKDTLIILNTKSPKAIFDVSLAIPESMKRLALGRALKAFISLTQVGEEEETDVVAKYTIKDFDGNTVLTESETFRVFRSKNYVREYPTLKLTSGEYIAAIEIEYPGGFASASSRFTVVNKKYNIYLIPIILVLFTIAAIVYSYINYRKVQQKYKTNEKLNNIRRKL